MPRWHGETLRNAPGVTFSLWFVNVPLCSPLASHSSSGGYAFHYIVETLNHQHNSTLPEGVTPAMRYNVTPRTHFLPFG